MGYLDAQAGDEERTAFRRAEKRYKFYKHSSTSARSSKRRQSVPPTDLSEVLDFRQIKRLGVTNGNGITRLEEGLDMPVFTMEKHPGFYFIPEALELREQMHWIKESLVTFPQPPNRSNHTAVYGPLSELWTRAQNGEVIDQAIGKSEGQRSLQEPRHTEDCSLSASMSKMFRELDHVDDQPVTSDSDATNVCYRYQANGNAVVRESDVPDISRHSLREQPSNNNSMVRRSIPMKNLLRKLRWTTLGLQFDWSKRAYDLSLPHNKIPQDLCDLAGKLASPAMKGSHFRAEAAIVNYFGYDDMLGGHLDDMEADWSKPIVSISFGCKTVFLLGGPSRDENPTAMFLRSGDVVLMAGPARGCFHGIPRIFVDSQESDLPDFPPTDREFQPFLEYIKTSRINLNIRQVF